MTRLLIIGLDGATFDILRPLAARGELPTLARLMEQGAHGELLSTMPPVTLPAWTSFLTGVTPGHHGVTDIFVRRGYELVPASGALREAQTFLEVLSRRGRRVASIGVPGTYPPLELNGICIAGFDAPGVHRATRGAVSPRALWSTLEDLGGYRYATFNEHRLGTRRLSVAADALCADIAKKERLLLALYEREPWDVFFTHLQASDTAAHHLWHTFDAGSPRAVEQSDALPRVYRRLDALIGRLLERASADTRVLVVSDHGMGGASTTAVHVNRALERAGLLAFRRDRTSGARRLAMRALGELSPRIMGTLVRAVPPVLRARAQRALMASPIDWRRTQAFSDELDYAPSIWLHRADVFEHGTVRENDVPRLVDTIVTRLHDLRDPTTGEPVVRAIHKREDIGFAGPCEERAPDLIIEPAWPGGYRPSFLRSRGPGPAVRLLTAAEHTAPKGAGMPGVHRREGVIIVHGPGVAARALSQTTIEQAGALVYELLGEARPEMTARPPTWNEPYTEQQRANVEARLRALGYVD